jgi:hypothetical protein
MAMPPNSTNVKVTLRATPIGSRVIERLDIPNMDKSAEVRRLAELGMAAELAGFSLDGTVLRFGGRVWDLRPELKQAQTAHQEPVPVKESASASAVVSLDADGASHSVAAPVAQASGGNGARHSSLENADAGDSPLRANLRGLSGGA